jgi:hypothetical protein
MSRWSSDLNGWMWPTPALQVVIDSMTGDEPKADIQLLRLSAWIRKRIANLSDTREHYSE